MAEMTSEALLRTRMSAAWDSATTEWQAHEDRLNAEFFERTGVPVPLSYRELSAEHLAVWVAVQRDAFLAEIDARIAAREAV